MSENEKILSEASESGISDEQTAVVQDAASVQEETVDGSETACDFDTETIDVPDVDDSAEKAECDSEQDAEPDAEESDNKLKKRPKALSWLLLFGIMIAGFAVTLLVNYIVSNFNITSADVKQAVTSLDVVEASELQDEDGNYVILDYPEDVDILSYVTLGDYRNMTVDAVDSGDMSDEAVEAMIENYISYYGTYDTYTEGTVAEGDIINVTYVGYLDDVADGNYTVTENTMILGSAGEPDDFVENVDGAEIGETIEFDVTFPDDWSDESYAGVTMMFRVTVNAKYEIPEVTDENVSEITNGAYETRDEFIQYVKDTMESYYLSNYESELSDEILDQLVEEASFGTLPHELLTWYVSTVMVYYSEMADQYGMEVEDYLTYAGIADSLDEFLEELSEEAVEDLKEYAVLDAVALSEGITVDEDEDADYIELRKEQLIESFGLSGEAKLLSYYRESNILHDVRNWKVMDYLMETVNQE